MARAPASANLMAVAAPIPRDAPVMIAMRPDRFINGSISD
jgi:hypothetical protein